MSSFRHFSTLLLFRQRKTNNKIFMLNSIQEAWISHKIFQSLATLTLYYYTNLCQLFVLCVNLQVLADFYITQQLLMRIRLKSVPIYIKMCVWYYYRYVCVVILNRSHKACEASTVYCYFYYFLLYLIYIYIATHDNFLPRPMRLVSWRVL